MDMAKNNVRFERRNEMRDRRHSTISHSIKQARLRNNRKRNGRMGEREMGERYNRGEDREK